MKLLTTAVFPVPGKHKLCASCSCAWTRDADAKNATAHTNSEAICLKFIIVPRRAVLGLLVTHGCWELSATLDMADSGGEKPHEGRDNLSMSLAVEEHPR